ncbi:MAG: UDP-N-acetylmuramoyl-L-alanyl-D-glutamate--2,6-diaminopimelate ligase, partial [Armatimonadetes bacterium]|nr:UDP-N-acetylmuramoyl-L-alanyl-D-glutamate--2,6-diaminopimelate ligase [Armatimonadota bacterium]
MPTLQKLTDEVPDLEIHGAGSVHITGIAYDSRTVTPGNLFVCIKGFKTDGHRFIQEALARGAAAVLIEGAEALSQLPTGFSVLVAPDSRRALAEIACAYYSHPSRKLCLVAVTGTNGKTTTAHLVASILNQEGYRSGVIGTLGASILGDEGELELQRTTPESVDLQRLLAEFVGRGIQAVTMEVSSHALRLERVRGCAFDIAVFTNLTQDHLDFHESLDEYRAAKARLFTDYADSSIEFKQYGAVINADDAAGLEYAALCPLPTLTYGIQNETAHLKAEAVTIEASGAAFTAIRPGRETPIKLKITGRFNVYNALAAFGVGEMLELDPKVIRGGLEAVDHLPGRLQMIYEGQPFGVCVDYAHTPDGLEKVLHTAREIAEGRLITLFGCGGDRDPGKRPMMGSITASLSDIVVVTSDNPRSEEPEKIIEDILAGIPEGGQCHVEPDREKAIGLAISLARAGDFVVLAGKGHETYQIFKDRTIHFDDREMTRGILR